VRAQADHAQRRARRIFSNGQRDMRKKALRTIADGTHPLSFGLPGE